MFIAFWEYDIWLRRVRAMQAEFEARYGIRPRYLKVPYGFIDEVANAFGDYMRCDQGHDFENAKFMGLKVCESIAVDMPDKVEVF